MGHKPGLRERVRKGEISPKDAIALIEKRDPNPITPFIGWAKGTAAQQRYEQALAAKSKKAEEEKVDKKAEAKKAEVKKDKKPKRDQPKAQPVVEEVVQPETTRTDKKPRKQSKKERRWNHEE